MNCTVITQQYILWIYFHLPESCTQYCLNFHFNGSHITCTSFKMGIYARVRVRCLTRKSLNGHLINVSILKTTEWNELYAALISNDCVDFSILSSLIFWYFVINYIQKLHIIRTIWIYAWNLITVVTWINSHTLKITFVLLLIQYF